MALTQNPASLFGYLFGTKLLKDGQISKICHFFLSQKGVQDLSW